MKSFEAISFISQAQKHLPFFAFVVTSSLQPSILHHWPNALIANENGETDQFVHPKLDGASCVMAHCLSDDSLIILNWQY